VATGYVSLQPRNDVIDTPTQLTFLGRNLR